MLVRYDGPYVDYIGAFIENEFMVMVKVGCQMNYGDGEMDNRDTSTTIYFVRHGHVLNLDEVHYGRLPGFPLSEEGQRQALIASDKLRSDPIAAIFSSPQLRARETAQIIIGPHEDLILNISVS